MVPTSFGLYPSDQKLRSSQLTGAHSSQLAAQDHRSQLAARGTDPHCECSHLAAVDRPFACQIDMFLGVIPLLAYLPLLHTMG